MSHEEPEPSFDEELFESLPEPRSWPGRHSDADPSALEGSAEMTYMALGPDLTHELIRVLGSAREAGVEVHEPLARWIDALHEVDGRRPDHLLLLAVAVGCTQQRFLSGPANREDQAPTDRHVATALKVLGSALLAAMRRFGLTEDELRDYLENHFDYGDAWSWPPPRLSYSKWPPGWDDPESRSGWIPKGFLTLLDRESASPWIIEREEELARALSVVPMCHYEQDVLDAIRAVLPRLSNEEVRELAEIVRVKPLDD